MMAFPFRMLLYTTAALLLSLVTGVRGTLDLEGTLKEAYRNRGRVTESTVQIKDLSSPVRYLLAGPPAIRAHRLVVLIHGGIFSADTWKWVGTLDHLAVAGMSVVALDLERYQGPFASQALRSRLLKDFLAAIGFQAAPKSLIIVSASMGGTVAIPYCLDASLSATVAGYVSVSALGLPSVSSSRGGGMVDDEGGNPNAVAPLTSIPALLLWGALDHPDSAKERAHEFFFPSHQLIVIPDAPHPAYLKDPQLFDDLVVRFALGKKGKVNSASGPVQLEIAAAWEPSGKPRQDVVEL